MRGYIPAHITQIWEHYAPRGFFKLHSTYNLKWHLNSYQLSVLGLHFGITKTLWPYPSIILSVYYLQTFATSLLLTLSFTPHLLFGFLLLSQSEM